MISVKLENICMHTEHKNIIRKFKFCLKFTSVPILQSNSSVGFRFRKYVVEVIADLTQNIFKFIKKLKRLVIDTRFNMSLVLQSLEKKGLSTLDYDIPIKGFQNPDYSSYPIVGSFALSARGQHVLELLDLQGIQ